MQWVTLKIKGWGRPNLVRNTKEKNLKTKEKCGMIGWANPCISCLTYARLQVCMMQLETMSEMMLKKKWLCKLFELLSWIWFDHLSTNCMKRTTHATISRGRSSITNLKWVLKGNGPKVLAPTISNFKSGWWLDINLVVMVIAISAQFLK